MRGGVLVGSLLLKQSMLHTIHHRFSVYPLCNTQLLQDNTTHLFTCTHVPTQLMVMDLWTNPRQSVLLF